MAYAKTYEKKEEDAESYQDDEKQPQENEEEAEEDFFNIERIVREYSTIKSVLINNSFPVDLATLQSGQEFHVGS